ncbi:F-box/WD repeat-containing protein 4 [Frankliniella fusca]|uniref:F-box/WD repeat-containing protein 4 n=1 Tax=Frankliniella fusca TaxID=407009 RepID=A0AAE1HD08_9NEOP|nr:F-box/WD repeat-containing protein 4 [Frankliniella fusca]
MSDSCPLAEGIKEEGEYLLFQDLPTDVLLSIFRYCDTRALLSLSQTCRRVNSIINEDFVWLERSRKVNVSNQVSEEIKNRHVYSQIRFVNSVVIWSSASYGGVTGPSFTILPCKERCRISQNWNSGRYQETIYLNNRTKFMPWLQLERDVLWFSRGRQILALKRRLNAIGCVPAQSFVPHREDVSRFVVKSGMVISGGRDGSLSAWTLRQNKKCSEERFAHNSDITDVDYDGHQVIVTASKDETIKVWSLEDDKIKPKMSVVTDDRVWTVALQPGSSSMLCYGMSGHHHTKPPLCLYNVERCQMASLKYAVIKRGAGVLDVIWEDPNTLVSCGYDSIVRMWDVRTLSCVRFWSDPFDVVLYSLASDYSHSLLCGTAQHGRVQMWDKRHTRSLQMYFMNSDHSSPVYSLQFDPTHLFVALDQSLNMMDFSGFRNRAWQIAKDYRHFYVHSHVL